MSLVVLIGMYAFFKVAVVEFCSRSILSLLNLAREIWGWIENENRCLPF